MTTDAIHIQNGHLIDPKNNIDKKNDVFVKDGKVVGIGKAPDGFQAEQIIDATDCVVSPGFVEICGRLREPGHENKGTIASETFAAVAGGITTVCVPPDTDPVIDTPAVAELILHRAKAAGFANVVTLGALTHRLRGELLAELNTLKTQGHCVGVSNAMHPINNILIVRRAMEYAASCDLTVFIHAEDPELAGDGCAHEGMISTRLGLDAIPESAETSSVSQMLMLIEQTGVRAHFYHISTAAALDMITNAQAKALPVTVDVATPYLHLTDMDIGYFNSNCHVRPPLRSQRDKEGLRQAIKNGIVNVISSDHQPHDADAKLAPFADTEPGISGFETLLPLSLRLVEDAIIALPDLIAKLTTVPATILGIDKGHLSVGADADITIFNPSTHWTIDTRKFRSQGHNSPFNGWEVNGKVMHTLVAGKAVYEAED